MADGVVLNPGSGGATMATLDDGTFQWSGCAVAYATTLGNPDVLQVVTPSFGLPVAQQGTWSVTAVQSVAGNLLCTASQGGSWTVAATQSGTWTVQPGNTANTTPWLFSLNAGGNTASVTASNALLVDLSATAANATAIKVDGSAVTQPVSGTVTANAGTGTFTVTGAVTQSGTWSVRTQDGSGNSLTSLSTGSQRPLTVAVMDASGNQITSFGGSGGTASNFGSAFPSTGTAIGAKDSAGTNMAALNLDASGNLKVNVAAGAASGGTSSSYGASFPATGTASGFSDGTNMQGARVFDYDSGGGTQYVLGVGLRLSGSGGSVEGGTGSNPIRIDPTGSTTQPVSGTVTANAGTGTFTVSGAVTQSGTWTVQPGNTANTTPWLTTINQGGNSAAVTGSNALKVDGSAVTQPVSGTVTANAGTGTFTVSGAVTQSGTWNIGTLTSISNALPSGSNIIGIVSACAETNTVFNGVTPLTPKFAVITASSSGNTQVVAAVTSKKIRVLRYQVSANGAVNVKFQSNTTDVTGLNYLTQYASAGGAFCPVGLFETASGEALNINLSGAVAVGGVCTYIEV